MSEIPSDIASSAAQSPVQARETVKEQSARRAGQAHAAGRHVRTVDESGVIVETSDSDTRVFTDAEGSGSQGRETEDHKPDDAAPDGSKQPAGGITTDDQGRQHLDLDA